MDTAVDTIMKLGWESYLTITDIRNPFRLCPVAPADMHLLGIKWVGQYYFEWVLLFGLTSSPFIFDKLASAIDWILANTCHLEHVMHYLDDFLDVCPPHLHLASHHNVLLLDTLAYMHVPVAPEKVDGRSTVLTFLSQELDTGGLEIRRPEASTSGSGSIASSLKRSHRQDSSSASLRPCWPPLLRR